MSIGERAITAALAALALLCVAACDQQSLIQKFASPEDQANATKVIDDLRNGNFEEIEKATDSSISSGRHDETSYVRVRFFGQVGFSTLSWR